VRDARSASRALSVPVLNDRRSANYNIEQKCKAVDASAFDPKASLNARIERCARDEQAAKDQLQTQWSQFAPSNKKMCMGLTTDDSLNPSYIELLTCLQGQQLDRKPPKD